MQELEIMTLIITTAVILACLSWITRIARKQTQLDTPRAILVTGILCSSILLATSTAGHHQALQIMSASSMLGWMMLSLLLALEGKA